MINVDEARGIAVDATGSIYVTGQTSSPDFPTTPGAFQSTLRGGGLIGTDVFVVKLDATGRLAYSTYLGGCDDDFAGGIAVDAAGNALVVGETFSADFPTINAMQPRFPGMGAACITKLDPTGTVLFSTYLGGSHNNGIAGVTTDTVGSVYVSGGTDSPDFSTTLNACRSDGDAFVVKLSPTGSLIYSTCFGGSQGDSGGAIVVDATGVYVAGGTGSADFPTTPGVLQSSIRRTNDFVANGFVAKLDLDGARFVYSTLLPMEGVHALAVDHAGAAYVTGQVTPGTVSIFTPSPGAFQGTPGSNVDAVVIKLEPGAQKLVYAT